MRELKDGTTSVVRQGLLIAVAVSLLSWRGNTTPHTVQLFPDGLTVLVFLLLLGRGLRQRFQVDQSIRFSRLALGGLRLAAIAGLGFGTAMILLGVLTWERAAFPLYGLTFAGTFLVSIACGFFAAGGAWLSGRVVHRPL